MWAGTDLRWFPGFFFFLKKQTFIYNNRTTIEQDIGAEHGYATYWHKPKLAQAIRTERLEDLMGLGFSSALCSITVQRSTLHDDLPFSTPVTGKTLTDAQSYEKGLKVSFVSQ